MAADDDLGEDGLKTGGDGGDGSGTGTQTRKRRTRRSSAKTTTSRLDRRKGQIEETLKEVVTWLRLEETEDDRELGLVDTVDRDAERIGTGIAAIGERWKPAGQVIDLLFGVTGPLAIFVALAPTVRAARREALAALERRTLKRKQRQQEKAAAEETAAQAQEGLSLVDGIPMPTDDPWADAGGVAG